MQSLPDLVVHADWGSDPGKRWMCVAELSAHGSYTVDAPELVGDLAVYLDQVLSGARGGRAFLGLDFPIGLPADYAQLAGIADYREALPRFGTGQWSEFYEVARRPDQISVRRPFYPYRPGGTKQEHLLAGIGVKSIRQLLRRCDRATPSRNAASPIFWTLGGKQVGKAAIIGWRDVLAPALRADDFALQLWPFDGDLPELLEHDGIVVAETYPAEACVHLGITPPGRTWSKTSQADRKRRFEQIREWSESRKVSLSPQLADRFRDGFGAAPEGEDAFDATIGALSMLEVALGHRAPGAPDDPTIRRVEGWILGQMETLPPLLAV